MGFDGEWPPLSAGLPVPAGLPVNKTDVDKYMFLLLI
jgi:hypothetical protein